MRWERKAGGVKEKIINEMGTKGGWGKATQRNQPKEDDLCHTSARP